MNKVVKIGLLGLIGVGIFSAGSYSEATGDWMTTVINNANSELGSAGYQTKTDLITNSDADIQATMQASLQPEIDAQEAELRRLLEEYYNLKLQGLTESPEYLQVQAQIATIRESILARYKAEIDAVFQ